MGKNKVSISCTDPIIRYQNNFNYQMIFFSRMVPSGWSALLLLALARSVVLQTIPEACGGLNMGQVRMVTAQAISNARNALMQQKQLNEYMSKIGKIFISKHAGSFIMICFVVCRYFSTLIVYKTYFQK